MTRHKRQPYINDRQIDTMLRAAFKSAWVPEVNSLFLASNPRQPDDPRSLFTYFCRAVSTDHVIAVAVSPTEDGFPMVLPISRFEFRDASHLADVLGLTEKLRQLTLHALNQKPLADG